MALAGERQVNGIVQTRVQNVFTIGIEFKIVFPAAGQHRHLADHALVLQRPGLVFFNGFARILDRGCKQFKVYVVFTDSFTTQTTGHFRHHGFRATQEKLVIVTDGDGRTTTFELGADGANLLDAALAHGLDVPFSCQGGVCATCKTRLVAGEVDMDLNHALGPEELAQGLILSCQAHPVSDRVSVDFDQT